MAKEIKLAEKALTDSDKFPRESFRERLSRQYGMDAVALSGPCEGQNLVDCIVDQLEKRWDRISERFSGNHSKAFKLATKLAESYLMKDDTEICLKDLQQLGYKEAAANGIASYLKAYAMGPAAGMEMEQAMGNVMAEEPAPAPMDDMSAPEEVAPPADDMAPMDDMGGDMGAPMEEPAAELPPPEGEMGAGTVTLELPVELAEQLKSQIEMSMPEGDMGMGMEAPGVDMEVVDMAPEGDLGIEEVGADEVIPGEPGEGAADHEVHGEPGEEDAAMMMAGHGETCSACGASMASSGHEESEMKAIEDLKHGVEELEHHEQSEEKGEQSAPEHESEEKDTAHEMKKDLKPFEKGDAEKEENKEFGEEVYKEAMKMRSGYIRAAGTKRAAANNDLTKTAFENNYEKKTPKDYNKPVDGGSEGGEMRRLNNPMNLNSTDQLLHMEGKELGNAKEKTPDAPKPIFDGNLETEGYSAGDKKFQDGSTMGHEEKFNPHEIQESEWTGGEKSIMGKDESFPKDKPQVPAGSSPIGGEPWQGGDLSTKGTVIASVTGVTITPKGVMVEASNGKKYLAKGAIKNEQPILAKIQSGLEKLSVEDAKAFAQAAAKIVKEAEESGNQENVTKIDTSKLEAEKFTNDGEKKPVEGGAMTGKGKGSDYQNEDIVKTDTSKLEKEKFTNDGEKKADDDTKTASADKAVKTAGEDMEKKGPKEYNKEVTHAGDKAVGEPKPVDEQVEVGKDGSSGYTAGDNKFQDGKTMGHEEKFDPHKIEEKEYTGGESSLQGKDESFPKDKPKVPAGGGQMGKEPWEGGNVETKGTVIADNNSPKRSVEAEELQKKLAEATLEKARIQAASVYVADLLANGDIRREDYVQELEKVSQMSVPAIQNLIAHTRKMRERIAARVVEASRQEGTASGLSFPVVRTASNNEMSLKDRLVAEFKLTKKLDEYDEMKK